MTAHVRAQKGQPDNPARPYTPRLLAYPRDDGLTGLQVWCRWCDCWHFHGSGYGHRAAHCHNSESPYLRTGYVLTRPAGSTARHE